MLDATIKSKLVIACRILHVEGHGDGPLGHISAKVPYVERFYMKPSGFGFEEVTEDKLVLVDMEGNRVEGEYRVHKEVPIHTEIYRLRDDVACVVHTHPFYSIIFSATEDNVKSISHDGLFFYEGVPRFENPELIMTKWQGEALARKLGRSNCIILRNHGIVTVGKTIEEACLMAVELEKAIKIQLVADSAFETYRSISNVLARKMCKTACSTKKIKDLWLYYSRKAFRDLKKI